MLKGFREFIATGNVIDMAVGVVMGSAVTAIVTSIVDNFINPLIAMIFGKPDMSDLLVVTFNGSSLKFGAILTAIINFLIIAASVYFCIVVPVSKLTEAAKKLQKQEADAEAAEESSKEDAQIALLTEIRDSLKAQNTNASGASSAPTVPQI